MEINGNWEYVALIVWSVLGILFYCEYLDNNPESNNWQRVFTGFLCGPLVFIGLLLYITYFAIYEKLGQLK